MGQYSSTHCGGGPKHRHRSLHPTSLPNHHRSASDHSQSDFFSLMNSDEDESPIPFVFGNRDYTDDLPDECLALIFQCLSSGDRKKCSLVSRRWLLVEGQSHHRLALNAKVEILPHVPTIFTRFDSVTKLALRCDRKSVSINDEALTLISLRCSKLIRLKLRGCRDVTEVGMSAFARNCKSLKKFSCGSCMFGAKGMNALLDNCSSLEELSVKRLRGINDGFAADPIGPGAAASSLKSICLKELYNGQCFAPLITGSKNLKTLKLLRCLGDWDRLFETIGSRENHVSEIHLERLQVGDTGLTAISNCPKLEILHLVKTPECTDAGVVAVASKCKLLRKLHIDGWRTNRIGDEGLVAIAENSSNLKELVLIGLNPTSTSLLAIASNCKKLERLALCGSDTIGDPEVSCIATKCMALKKLCIKGCEVTDQGIESFAWGCPNLVKIKVKKCKHVTGDVADRLRARRQSLAVNLDGGEIDIEPVDSSASDGGAIEEAAEFQHTAATLPIIGASDIPSTSNVGRSSASKPWFGIFGGRGLVACTLRRWSNGNGESL
ncbi:F-box protein At1g47056-like [Solanum tuberosum]|uniref:Avr9/Cf-9 rapidly elicited protein 189 n=1 Tax=Solanum tuberosum TaxID=4113 RepID=M1CC09_SOLTU|nr:PREDICTED: F-box protein At1g47056-like [Solanum tuberosum]